MSQQQQSHDPATEMLWVLMGIFIVVFVIKLLFGDQLVAAFLMLRKGWVDLFSLVLHTKGLHHAKLAIETYDPKEWTGRDLSQLSMTLRPYMIVPLGGIFGGYAYSVWKKNPTNSYRRVHSRQTLCQSEVRQWPWISPILGLDLVKESIDSGKWAMAKTPLAFARHYQLLDDGKTLNQKRAEKLFASQLGALWDGPEKLRPHVRALFACFIAQACRDKDGARDGLRALALGMASKKVDYSFVDPLLKQHYNDPRVQAFLGKNAYVTTVMCAAVAAARATGVLPPAYFVWLRPVDRSLWYALNGVGRRTPFCETAGIHAHRLAEDVAGHAIERPYVIEAVKGLDKALRDVKFD